MMNSSLISVIVPVYNKEAFIPKLIDCIKEQTFKDFECVLVDDGSTDNSGKLCDILTSGNDLFSVIHIPNGGVSHARNTALDLAKGEYITFVDSDDEIPADYLQKIADDIRTYHPDMVIGAIKKVFGNESQLVKYPFEERLYTMQELLPQFAEVQEECGVFGWCVNKTFKRELAIDCRFDETLNLSEDFDFYLKLYPMITTILFDCKPQYFYLCERSNFDSLVDSDIDYIAQVKVQLRCKEYLENFGAWSENNKAIVSDRIQNYLFFTVFHCPKEFFEARFAEAHEYYLKSGIIINDSRLLNKIILGCVANNQRGKAKRIITLYQKLSNVFRKA